MRYKITLLGRVYILEHQLKTIRKTVIMTNIALIILAIAFIIKFWKKILIGWESRLLAQLSK